MCKEAFDAFKNLLQVFKELETMLGLFSISLKSNTVTQSLYVSRSILG